MITEGPNATDRPVVPRLYGAAELGVLSVLAPGEAHPRVRYVGGELFVGLDALGAGDGERAAVTQGEVEQWPQPFEEVLAQVLASAGPLPEPVDGVIVTSDEARVAAVLIDPGRMAGVPVDGAPVLVALSRDRLVLVGARDEAGLARVLDLAEERFEAGGPLVSAHPIVLEDGAWAPFPWGDRSPELQSRFHRVIRLFGVRAYEAQSAALQRPDVHLADPKVHVREDGVTVTFAAWPKGTATLLPVVDNVVIADPSGSVSVATMGDFLEAAGDAVVRTGLSPARYFVPGAPPRDARDRAGSAP